MPASPKSAEIVVPTIERETITVGLVGDTGLYCHRMSAKAKRQLMIGGRKKSAAERLELKHDPRTEFADSMHVDNEGFHLTPDHPPSHVKFPSMAIKSAMGTAALAVAGIRKTDVQRLVFLPDEWVPIYGIPRLRMDITRSADINRTPDVRTRAYFERWGTMVRIRFAKPALSKKAIVALLVNAGMMCGIGDNRQEKGKGSYGTFSVGELAPELLDSKAQWEAIQKPLPANEETAELMQEFDAEVEARS